MIKEYCYVTAHEFEINEKAKEGWKVVALNNRNFTALMERDNIEYIKEQRELYPPGT